MFLVPNLTCLFIYTCLHRHSYLQYTIEAASSGIDIENNTFIFKTKKNFKLFAIWFMQRNLRRQTLQTLLSSSWFILASFKDGLIFHGFYKWRIKIFSGKKKTSNFFYLFWFQSKIKIYRFFLLFLFFFFLIYKINC